MRPGRAFRSRTARMAAAAGGLILLVGCHEQPPQQAGGGDPARGRELIREYGCVSCHVVPGVRGADGLVGPPLIHWSRRVYIAGHIPNTAENTVRWIMDPRAFAERTAMPDLGVTEPDARHIAAYLYTLR
jgi:cytochrome c